jgi:hypothetical protein
MASSASPKAGSTVRGGRTAKIAMFDIKIECMRFGEGQPRRAPAKLAGVM